MDEEMKEYVIFTDTAKDGSELEFAVVDEFELGSRNYVVAGLVKDDEIDEDSLFIYRVKKDTTEFEVEKITDPREYDQAASAYLEMNDEAK